MATDNRYILADEPFYTVDGVRFDDVPLKVGELVIVEDAHPDEEGDVYVETEDGEEVYSINRDVLVSVSNLLAAYGAVQSSATPLDEPKHRVTLASSSIRPNVLADVLTEHGADRLNAELIVARALLFSAQ
ncbi:hypothetical protein SEA_HONK_43 [Microbacterium phage Honk]|uniref:Uncharacterized protein n=1 Tax=Microbacterium phage Honk TaxID=2836095 RepID=A0A8F3EBK9_9CAUD|nr:hypothetical protein SEA_HONK_43 [Microbacterium phage Honk]